MSAVKELKVRISADTKGLKGALNGLSDDISKIGKDFEGLNRVGEGFKDVGKKMTLVGAGIVASIGGIVAKGSEWSAQIEGQKFLYNNLDKSIQKSIDSNSKNAQAIGLTAQQYKNGATTISTYYKNMGMTTDETSKLSSETMNLVADLAAVVDMPFDEAMSRFKSGLMGNYEALDTFGINLSANTLQNSEFVKSLGKSWNKLSDNEKMMAAYNEILRQSAPMTGLAAQEAESFGMKFKLLKQQVSETVGEIGLTLLPVLEPLIQKFSEVANKISEWVQEHPKLTQGILMVVGVIGTLMVVLGPILVLIGTAITTFVTLSAVAGALGVSIGALCAPILIAIAAIVALIAIGVALWQNWEEVKAFASKCWEAIKNYIVEVCNTTAANIKATWEGIKNFLSICWNGLKSLVTTVWNAIKSTISSVCSGISSTISSIWNAIKSTVSSVCSGVSSTVSNAFNGLKNAISSAMNSVYSTVSSVWNKVKSIFSAVLKPNIKIPKISISGSFSLNPPSVPKFGISWYSKGAIFKRPTVLGGMGVGDKHNGIGSNAEAILPINQLPKLLGLDKLQNNNGIALNIENFNNNTDKDIEYLANELAFYMRRKSIGMGGAY